MHFYTHVVCVCVFLCEFTCHVSLIAPSGQFDQFSRNLTKITQLVKTLYMYYIISLTWK